MVDVPTSTTFQTFKQSSADNRHVMEYLWKVGLKYSKTSPSLSRHFMLVASRRIAETAEVQLHNAFNRHACCVCGTAWILGNCIMRVASKRKISKTISRLKKLRTSNRKRLTKRQLMLLKMESKFSQTRVSKCGVCKRTTKIQLKLQRQKDCKPQLNKNSQRSNYLSMNRNGTETRQRNKRSKLKRASKKPLNESRERLLEQIRDAKVDQTKLNKKKGNRNNKLVSVVKNILKSDDRKEERKSGHQLLSFFSNL